MGKLSLTGNAATRKRYADLPSSIPYITLLASQGATHYWAFQNARTEGVTEPDLIDSKDLVMNGGGCTALSAGDGPLGGNVGSTDKGIVTVVADTERMTQQSLGSIDTRQNFSWSGWIRTSTLSGNGPIFCQMQTDSTHYLFVMHRDDQGGYVVQIGAGGSAVFIDPGTINLADSAWHHLALTRAYNATASSDLWKLYKDGSQVAATDSNTLGITPSSTGTAATIAFLGRFDNDGDTYGGDSAHFQIAVGTTMSAAQITAQWDARL